MNTNSPILHQFSTKQTVFLKTAFGSGIYNYQMISKLILEKQHLTGCWPDVPTFIVIFLKFKHHFENFIFLQKYDQKIDPGRNYRCGYENIHCVFEKCVVVGKQKCTAQRHVQTIYGKSECWFMIKTRLICIDTQKSEILSNNLKMFHFVLILDSQFNIELEKFGQYFTIVQTEIFHFKSKWWILLVKPLSWANNHRLTFESTVFVSFFIISYLNSS